MVVTVLIGLGCRGFCGCICCRSAGLIGRNGIAALCCERYCIVFFCRLRCNSVVVR